MNDIDLDYLEMRLLQAKFTPYPWDGEDKNIGAFRSRRELIEWYCQPPGIVNQPYRDRAFYTRELAHLSKVIQPRTVVEFGTCQGIGTCLLKWLNPAASLVTVDVNSVTYLPGDIKVEIGHLSKHQDIRCDYVLSNSWEYVSTQGVDLCFIDANHSYEAVVKDSERAWLNVSRDHPWCIIWHDHNVRHPGVMRAVEEFCTLVKIPLQSREDSDTVWIIGGN